MTGRIVSGFGVHMHTDLNVKVHRPGIDIAASVGAEIRAVERGRVLLPIACRAMGTCSLSTTASATTRSTAACRSSTRWWATRWSGGTDRLGRERRDVRPVPSLLRGQEERQAGGSGPLVPGAPGRRALVAGLRCRLRGTRINQPEGTHDESVESETAGAGLVSGAGLGAVRCRAAGAAGFGGGTRGLPKPGDVRQYPRHRPAELRQGGGYRQARHRRHPRVCWALWIPTAAI